MVESASLLTRYPLTGIMGSNPIVSADILFFMSQKAIIIGLALVFGLLNGVAALYHGHENIEIDSHEHLNG